MTSLFKQMMETAGFSVDVPHPVCISGSLNPATGLREITTTPTTCPQGITLSGNVCAAHPIPKGPKQT